MTRLLAFMVILVAASVSLPGPPVLLVVNVTESFATFGDRASGVFYWVPESAPIETMAAGTSDVRSCSPELTTWLNENASKVMFPQQILITNSSVNPQKISFGLQNGKTAPPEKGFYFQCGVFDFYDSEDDPLLPKRRWDAVQVELLPDKSVTVQRISDPTGAYELTLRPGQQIGMTIYLQGPARIQGQIRIVAHDKRASSYVLIPVLERGAPTNSFSWPGIPPWASLLVHPLADSNGRSEFYCKLPGTARDDQGLPCSNLEILKTAELVRANPEPTDVTSPPDLFGQGMAIVNRMSVVGSLLKNH